jgi:hypothetical protein
MPKVKYGLPTTFNTLRTFDGNITFLTDTTFVVIFEDYNSSTLVRTVSCVVGTISNGNVSYGSKYACYSGDPDGGGYALIEKLTNTTFIAVYRNHVGAIVRSRVGTISGTTISYGTEATHSTSSSTPFRICILSSTKFAVLYTHIATSYVVIATISGTTITYGADYDLLAGYPAGICALDASTIIVAYGTTTPSAMLNAKVGTVSGTSIVFGSEYLVVASNTFGNMIKMSSTRVVIFYAQSAKVANISGTVITFGPQANISMSTNSYGSILEARVDSNHFMKSSLKQPSPYTLTHYYYAIDGASTISLLCTGTTLTEEVQGAYRYIAFNSLYEFVTGYMSNELATQYYGRGIYGKVIPLSGRMMIV